MHTTNKIHIRHLAAICAQRQIKHIVVCPGSRSAPIVIALSRQENIHLYAIVDERSAAYVALGMAQFLKQPVGLLCTSGTAALNFSPAIAEAYYQEIPLLILTADRPARLIGQQDGQAIKQNKIYQNFIEASFTLPEVVNNDASLLESDAIVNKAINIIIKKQKPVHINIPLEEPLYVQETCKPPSPKIFLEEVYNEEQAIAQLKNIFSSINWQEKKILVLLGNGDYTNSIVDEKILKHIIFVKDITAVTNAEIITLSEPLLHQLNEQYAKEYQPDILFTLGNGIVSKKMKQFLREYKPQYHYHIDLQNKQVDTYQCLSEVISISIRTFFTLLQQYVIIQNDIENNFVKKWQLLHKNFQKTLWQSLQQSFNFSDLHVFDIIASYINKHRVVQYLHLSNSTPVRHASLFQWNIKNIYANRGVSGIDGCTSTAAGFTIASQMPTLLITGDLSFFYDSNALWNQYLNEKLLIVIINNGGGNIFRLINDEQTLPELQTFFETPNCHNAKGIAETFGCKYYFCENKQDLLQTLPLFFKPSGNKPVVLEIKTSGIESAAFYKSFIHQIKQSHL